MVSNTYFTGFPHFQRNIHDYMSGIKDPLDVAPPSGFTAVKPELEPNIFSQIGSTALWGGIGFVAGNVASKLAVTVPEIATTAQQVAETITGFAPPDITTTTAALIGVGLFAGSRVLFGGKKTSCLRACLILGTIGAVAGGFIFKAPIIGAVVGFAAMAAYYEEHRLKSNLNEKRKARVDTWAAYLEDAGPEYWGSIHNRNDIYARRHGEAKKARLNALQKQFDRNVSRLFMPSHI